MIHKQYNFGGLNLRKSDLTVDKSKATDLRNVQLNYAGELIKRNGFIIDSTTITGETVIQLISYKEKNELLAMCSDGLYIKIGSDFTKVPRSPQDPSLANWRGDITSIEINGILYISDTTGNNHVYKYDGRRFYRAGCPVVETFFPDIPIDGGSGLSSPNPRDNQHYGSKVVSFRKGAATAYMVVMEEDSIIVYENATYAITDADPAWSLVQRITLGANVWDFDANADTLAAIVSPNFLSIYYWNVSQGKYVANITHTVGIGNPQLGNVSIAPIGDETTRYHGVCTGAIDTSQVFVYMDTNNGTPGNDGLQPLYGDFNPPIDTTDSASWGGDVSQFGSGVLFMNDDAENPEILVSTNGTQRHILRYHWNGIDTWLYRQNITNLDNATDTVFGLGMSRGFGFGENSFFLNMSDGTSINGKYIGYYYRVDGTDTDVTLRLKWNSDTYPGGSTNDDTEVNFGGSIAIDNIGSPQSTDLVVNSYSSADIGGGAIYIYPGFFDNLVAPVVTTITRMIPVQIEGNEARWGSASAIMNRANTDGTDLIIFASYGDDGGYTDVGYSTLFRREEGATEFIPIDAANTQRHFRYYYSFLDDKLNIINSNWTHREVDSANYELDLPNFYSSPYQEFSPLYATGHVDNETLPPRQNTAGFLRLRTTTKNVSIGDVLYIITYQGSDFNIIANYAYEPVRVTDIEGEWITISLELLRDNSTVGFTFAQGVKYDGTLANTRLMFFDSPDEWFNYHQVQLALSVASDYGFIIPNTKLILTSTLLEAITLQIFMDDLYDTTIIKSEIPKCKYLGQYQNHLLGANIEYDDELPLIKYKNTMVWSDFSIGGSLESFSPFDNVEIGVNDGTELRAVYGTQDNVFLFKEERVFWLSGILLQGQYKIRESLSDGIGCIAHNSMIQVDDGVMFMSNRGLYHVVGGNKPTEISDANEPLFSAGTIDLEQTITTLDPLNERVYVYLQGTTIPINSIFLIYDFYFKQWYVYGDISSTGPSAYHNKDMYISNYDEVRISSNDYEDDVSIIDVVGLPKVSQITVNSADVGDVAGKGFNLSVVDSVNNTTNIWYSDINNPSAQPTEPTATSSFMISVDFTAVDATSLASLTAFNINTYLASKFSASSAAEVLTVTNKVTGVVVNDQPISGDEPPVSWAFGIAQAGVDEERHNETLPVEAYYNTGWYDMDSASLRKKFVNFYAYSLLRSRDFKSIPQGNNTTIPPNFTLTVRTQIDWLPVDKEEFDVEFTSQIRHDDHKFEITQSHAMRLVFYNNLNENILLTGIEFEWAPTQTKPKGFR